MLLNTRRLCVYRILFHTCRVKYFITSRMNNEFIIVDDK